jgi:hypothetical protein
MMLQTNNIKEKDQKKKKKKEYTIKNENNE